MASQISNLFGAGANAELASTQNRYSNKTALIKVAIFVD